MSVLNSSVGVKEAPKCYFVALLGSGSRASGEKYIVACMRTLERGSKRDIPWDTHTAGIDINPSCTVRLRV